MNKTVNINIAKQHFHIDEDAFATLNQYLNNVKKHYESDPNGNEILEDIEFRVAELLNQSKTSKESVIGKADVEKVIHQLGVHEEWEDKKQNEKDNSRKDTNWEKAYQSMGGNRTLYRDPDNKILGGVCSGISHYFGIDDPIWLRLLFVFMVLTFGSGILIYIILWAIIPEANNSIDKIRMKGKPITLSEIEKNVKQEYDELTKRMMRGKGAGAQIVNFIEDLGKGMVRLVVSISKFLLTIIAIITVLVVGALFFVMTDFMFSKNSNAFTEGNGIWPYVLYACMFIILAVPFIIVIAYIIRKLFNLPYNNKPIARIGAGLWVLAFVMSGISVAVIASKFRHSESMQYTQEVYPASSDTLTIQSNPQYSMPNVGFTFSNNHFSILSDSILYQNVKFDIEPSPNDSMHWLIVKTARGNSRENAYRNAQNIKHKILQNDTLFSIDPYFIVNPNKMFRAQSVRLVLQLPVGKTVFLKDNLSDIISDVDNTTQTWDYDMLGNYWLMTPNGLSPLNKQLEVEAAQEKMDTLAIKDSSDHVEIETKDGKIKLKNKKGQKIVIDEDGVHIKQK